MCFVAPGFTAIFLTWFCGAYVRIWGLISDYTYWANKLKVTDHFLPFLPAKVDLNPANVEAEDS